MENISVRGGTLVDSTTTVVDTERKKVVETIATVNEGNPSVKGGSLVVKRIGEAVDVIQGGLEAMDKSQPASPDPDRPFYQSFREGITPPTQVQTQAPSMVKPQAEESPVLDETITSPQIKTKESPNISKPDVEDKPTVDSSTADEVRPTDGEVTSPSFIESFVNRMGVSEGTTDHTDQLGISTLGYGILPATAERLGFNIRSSQYADRKVLAKAVYSSMYDEAVNAYPDVFNSLSDNQKAGVMSLYINAGTLYDGVVNALSQETPDFDAAKTSLASTVFNSPRDDNEERLRNEQGKTIYTSNKGLSRRRAGEYNMLMEGTEGFNPVTTVEVEGTREQPTFVWRDTNNNEVHRYTPSVTGNDKVYQGLDSGSTMDSVGV